MQEVCDILERLVFESALSNYALGGATAAGFHGEPLATRDIDVFIHIEPDPGSFLISLSPLYARLAEMGFSGFEEEGLLIHGFPVQFLCASPGLETEAVAQALPFEWDDHRIRVMRPEHLAAIAISTGRPKDRARLVYLLSLPAFDQSLFQIVLDRHGLVGRWHEWATALSLQIG